MLSTALEHYRRQQRITAGGVAAARRARGNLTRLLAVVTTYQLAAAMDAEAAVPLMLAEQGIDPAADARSNTSAYAGVASDGRPLGSLLELAETAQQFDMIVATQLKDVARMAASVKITASRGADGYVRMLNPPSCSRCAIQAGKWFKWNAGFKRHPLCDCLHVPSSGHDAAKSEGLISDPQQYFDGLSGPQQDRVFTKAGAQAIRDGADINQVVNARRAAQGLSLAGGRLTAAEQSVLRGGRDRGALERVDVHGRQVFITREGVTTRGIAGRQLGDVGKRGTDRYRSSKVPRLMPESIYEIAAGDRDEAIRLLKRFGYLF